ncbi:unnamed protein product [Adineta ricciae]|uniref:Uncharacterized protein n=1 Tax=Adineta ricciae TaxID=249248 RepID=A0A815MCD3_ADIRI|nr:unnamed protein product [Adineta ricciae]
MADFIFIIFLSLCCILHLTSAAAAGWCYQCNSKNPRCGMHIDPSMKVDKTPCNGQCYTYIRKNIVYRGCSWEHGFMTPQITEYATEEKDGLWRFCNTSLCNSDGSSLIRESCDNQLCEYFDLPENCESHNLYTVCGKQCGNQMC